MYSAPMHPLIESSGATPLPAVRGAGAVVGRQRRISQGAATGLAGAACLVGKGSEASAGSDILQRRLLAGTSPHHWAGALIFREAVVVGRDLPFSRHS
jgi:hypothetical protein